MTDLNALQRCRVLWGEDTLVAGDPDIRHVRDVLYRPWSPAQDYGFHPVLADEPFEDAPDLDYLYVGNFVSHYGHFLIDTLSRFWPLLRDPDREFVLLAHTPWQDTPWQDVPAIGEILARFGRTAHDVVTFAVPHRIRRMTIPDSSFVERSRAHVVFGEVMRFVGRPFWSPELVDRETRPAYLSKSRLAGGVSRLVDEADLERKLERRGFDVIYPETLSLPEQVALFARRRFIVGTAGSALHTALMSAPGRRILALNIHQHLHANYALFDRLGGQRAFYYFVPGSTEGEHPGFSVGWTLDRPDRVAAELAASLAIFDRLESRDLEQERLRAKLTAIAAGPFGRVRLRLRRQLERARRSWR